MTSMEDERWVYWRNKAKQLEEENKQLKQQNNELIMVIKGIGRDTAQILSKNWKHWTYGDD